MKRAIHCNYLMIAVLIMLTAGSIGAGEYSIGPGDDPSTLLGLPVSGFLDLLGPPDSIYPLRGEEAWQDDVVCFYSQGISLYLYRDRVWQVRFDRNFQGRWRGIGIGALPADVAGNLGKAAVGKGEAWEVYFLEELPFPLRLRVFYKEGKAEDFYLYRGDF